MPAARAPARALPAALLLVAALAAAPAAGDTAPAGPAPGDLRIVEFASDPAAGAREFVEVHNVGNATVAMQGLTLKDAAGNTFTFPAWALAPRSRVVVWGGGAADAFGPAWSQATAWNNGGDTIVLAAADGTVLDEVAYGPAPAPLAAPAKGKSWALDLPAAAPEWVQGAPSPGSASGAILLPVTAEVANVAPSATLAVPPTAAPDAAVAATVIASDPNGPGDLSSWSLKAGTVELAAGTGAPPASVPFSAPSTGTLQLTLTVTDRAGLAATAGAALTVVEGLAVELPEGPVAFPTFEPGAPRVDATRPFVVRNAGAAPIVPLLDVSDLRGPGGTLPMAGHLQAVVTLGNSTVEVRYAGPLTPLPAVPPGAAATVLLRYLAVPSPLAAGPYGATFTVVA